MIRISSLVRGRTPACKMLSGFEKNVAQFIEANDLVRPDEKVLAAVSGGADSLALLHCLTALKAANALDAELAVAHINHQLRGPDAEADERFVIEQAKKLALPVAVKRIDVRRYANQNKLSIETAGRKLRRQALMDIAQKVGCQLIATAHNKNDNAETVLHRLLRGTGFRGLAGIQPKKSFPQNITFIRPLLRAGRGEILEYLGALNLKWRRDRTNVDTAYTRNYIRHHLLPALQAECNGELIDQLADLAQRCRNYYSYVMQGCEKAWPEVIAGEDPQRIEFDVKAFCKYPAWVKVALARKALTGLGCREQPLTRVHYSTILELAEQNVTGKQIVLPGEFVVRRRRRTLAFEKRRPQEKMQAAESVLLNVPGRTEFGNALIEASILDAEKQDLQKFKTQKNSSVEWFDLDRLALPLQVRRRRPAERFWPLGLAGEKKIGKFMTDARISHDLRENLIVIADTERIIWLAPLRPSEKTKITLQTRKILQLKLTS